MQAGHLPTQGSKACPRHGGSRFKVQPQRGSEIGMILRFEIEAARFAPAGKLDVCALIRANGHVLGRSEEHTSELQSLRRISYAAFCLKKKKNLSLVTHQYQQSLPQSSHNAVQTLISCY